ncbi:MAG: hypothetical protein LBL23_07210 [Coriobacteriales bacterium]|nr:hypothetical protein [Coriobacteriales bacterium]
MTRYLATLANLNELGFKNIERTVVREGFPDGTTIWFAHKNADDKELVFAFAEGTAEFPDLQWLSDASYIANKQGNHIGFEAAKEQAGKRLNQYVSEDTNDIDPDRAFFVLSGYSRGAGITDLLANGSEINGTKLTASNCNAVTFGTPNTIFNKKGGNISHITNVVGGNFLENCGGFGWVKNGRTIGYNYSQQVVDSYFGENIIGANYDGFIAHRVENYLANIFTKEPTHEYMKLSMLWAWRRIHCPTDVKVVLGDEIVASVIDNLAESHDSNVVVLTNDAGEKDIITPADGDYRIIVEATDNGQMNVSKTIIGYDPPESGSNEPKAYNIIDGEVYEIDFENNQPILLDGLADFSDLEDSEPDTPSKQILSVGSEAGFILLPIAVFLVAGIILLVAVIRGRRKR